MIRTTRRSSNSLDMKFTDTEQEHIVMDGELWLRSSQCVLGYINATGESIIGDGWFKTGDLVEDRGGVWLGIVGRKSDVIHKGGQKLQPADMGSFLIGHPEVADC